MKRVCGFGVLRTGLFLATMIGTVGAGQATNVARGQGIDYQRLRREAPELLHLRLDRVVVTDDGPDTINYRIDATVDKVERSAQNLKKGDSLSFESYYVRPEAWRRGFVGPKSPPILYPGWTGWIFLDNSPSGQGLGPAAYGNSFHYSYDLTVPRQNPQSTAKPPRQQESNIEPGRGQNAPPVNKPVEKLDFQQLGVRLAELQTNTVTALLEKGYVADGLKETEVMASDAAKSLEFLQKGDFEGWKRHYVESLKKALERSEQVRRLPKR